MRVKDPYLDGVTGGTIDAGTKLTVACDTPGSRIYYTTDGSPAELHIETVKVSFALSCFLFRVNVIKKYCDYIFSLYHHILKVIGF